MPNRKITRKRKASSLRKQELCAKHEERMSSADGPSAEINDSVSINDVSSIDEEKNLCEPSSMVKSEENNLSTDDESTSVDEHPLRAKFKFKERVYAKDTETKLLYEAIVRRCMYGTEHQRKIKMIAEVSDQKVTFPEEEPRTTWWYFVHYTGWNVKWDRWIAEENLFEATDATKEFAKKLQVELKRIRAELRKKFSGPKMKTQVAFELDRRISEMEYEHRMDERRNELAKRGEVMSKTEIDSFRNPKKGKKSKWTKSTIKKEMSYRERDLEGRRSQVSDLLVLPFSFKKIMVEEWEIITQCGMCANLPAKVTLKQVLDQYLEFKMESLGLQQKNGTTNPYPEKDTQKELEAGRELREMVDGICLFFDQSIPERLLYETEVAQHDALQSELGNKSNSEIYGCEYLLRMFLRLPSLLVGELPEMEAKSIFAKLNDLLRFLQKNQTKFFTQSYRRLNQTNKRQKVSLINDS